MMAKWFGRRGRWVLWIALAVVGLIGVADVTVRALAASGSEVYVSP